MALELSHGEIALYLIHEVKAARQVSQSNVCPVFRVERFEGRLYLSMKLVEGETLAAVLERAIGQLTD